MAGICKKQGLALGFRSAWRGGGRGSAMNSPVSALIRIAPKADRLANKNMPDKS